MTDNNPALNTGKSLAFAFGDPEPILTNRLTDYLGVFLDVSNDYFRPPVSLTGLADLMNANAYHGSILHFKKNMIVKWFMPGKLSKIGSAINPRCGVTKRLGVLRNGSFSGRGSTSNTSTAA